MKAEREVTSTEEKSGPNKYWFKRVKARSNVYTIVVKEGDRYDTVTRNLYCRS